MKIELDEKDLKYIQNINEGLSNGENLPVFIPEKGKRYFIEFTCEDVAKANAFAMMFMNPNPEKVTELREIFGITVNCISYCNGDSKLSELKQYLQSFLQSLENI